MMYVDFKAGKNEYKLRLSTRNTVQLERELGCNPLAIFGNGDTLPTVTVMVQVLHAALLQFHHGISLNDAYDIFDEYLNDGNSATDFIQVLLEIYKVSGLIKVEEDEKNV